jgi:uncharacterized RDD family membrane protein YckC
MFKIDPFLKKRVNAFTIDLLIIVSVNYFLMASFTNFLKVVFFHFPIRTQMLLIHKFKFIHSVSMLSIMFAYFTLFYFCTDGQTMGKMIMNLKVKSQNNGMSLKEASLRSLSYIFAAWFASIPFLLPFFRKDKKSLADLFSNTEVVFIEDTLKNAESEFQLTLLSTIEEAENEKQNAA